MKYKNAGLTSVVELSGVDTVITDSGISENKLQVMDKYKIKTIIA